LLAIYHIVKQSQAFSETQKTTVINLNSTAWGISFFKFSFLGKTV
jgi:hypothetical protein